MYEAARRQLVVGCAGAAMDSNNLKSALANAAADSETKVLRQR